MKKIAVMLPVAYRGGSLRAARNIARSIAYQAQQRGDDVQVVFSYVEGEKYDLDADFGDLKRCGIELRETRWITYPRTALQGAIKLLSVDERSLGSSEYCLPVDNANDFYDCDLWVVISDRLPAPLLPLRKYVCFIYDYIQRYDPEMWNRDESVWRSQITTLFSVARNAVRVFVSTPSTEGDLISYAGVEKARVSLLDLDFEPVAVDKMRPPVFQLPKNYFIWTSNSSHHKNHAAAVDALESYVQDLGGKLSVVITGGSTEYLHPNNKFDNKDPMLYVPQIQYVRNKLSRNPALRGRIQALGNVSEAIYAYVLENAKFLWHPGLFDNGTFSAIEAAYLGVPTLSARYPAQEYIDRNFELNMQFFDPHNPGEMAKALLAMENGAADIPLPTRTRLLGHDWKSNSAALYGALAELIW